MSKKQKLADTWRASAVCVLYDHADPKLLLVEMTHSHSSCQLLLTPRFSFKTAWSWHPLPLLSAWLISLWLRTWQCGQYCFQLSRCFYQGIEKSERTKTRSVLPKKQRGYWIRLAVCPSLLVSLSLIHVSMKPSWIKQHDEFLFIYDIRVMQYVSDVYLSYEAQKRIKACSDIIS